MKYNPYHGYRHKPWLGYGGRGYGVRVKTKHDWRYSDATVQHKPSHEYQVYWFEHQKVIYFIPEEMCRRCGKIHCRRCGCDTPWKRFNVDSAGSTAQKRIVHRAFRRQCKDAIHRELAGDDAVSHRFFISGDWLD